MPVSARDAGWMDAAVRFASTCSGNTADNPCVAALVVDRRGLLVARAVTARSGRPHAEPRVIQAAGDRTIGATLYVTLEPCRHHGKTPPCVAAVKRAGFSRVVIGQLDRDPRTAGAGARELQESGIIVDILVDHGPSADLHRAFFKRVLTGMPYVSAKLAVSRDGMVGRVGEGNVAVTGAWAKNWTHALRARVDGIAVGANTACLDNPFLTVRLKGIEDRSPRAFVLANEPFSCSENLKILQRGGQLIATSEGLSTALNSIARCGINHLLVEGGPGIINRLLDHGAIDEFHLLESSIVIGENGHPASKTPLLTRLLESGFVLRLERALGPDILRTFVREA